MTRTTPTGSRPPEYGIWFDARRRCTDPRAVNWEYYGGRGITMCQRWQESFAAFLLDMGPRPPGHELDRIDNDRGYEPGNCRWITTKGNRRNRSSNRRVAFKGKTQTLVEWCEELNLPYVQTRWRLAMGWSAAEAFTRPFRAYNEPVEYDGRSQSLADWCRELGLDYRTAIARVGRGWPIHRVLSKPVQARAELPEIEYEGRRQPLAAWCRELGLKYATVYSRLSRGHPPSKAFRR